MHNIAILQMLEDERRRALQQKEPFRARAFENAISAISKLDFDITNGSQVDNIRGIGKGIKQRIADVLINAMRPDPYYTAYSLFANIHGVGDATAREWIRKGYRTLDDLANVRLTKAQQIGLKYYDDFLIPIPRWHITGLMHYLRHALQYINREYGTEMDIKPMGSYRRQKSHSGDIDCIIYAKDNIILDREYIDLLFAKKILTDQMSYGVNKFMGVCVYDNHHMRIDFEFCREYAVLPYEMLYFTGNKNFNITMRWVAKQNGLVLNQKGLFKKGRLLPARTERDVFKHLEIPYVAPKDREY